MSKDPAFLFYSNDWVAGTVDMSFEEKGAYIELLALQHLKKGSFTEAQARKRLGEAYERVWPELSDKFETEEIEGATHYYNERLREEVDKRANYTKSRRANLKTKKTENHMDEQSDSHMQSHMDDHKEEQESPHMGAHMVLHMGSHMGNENENVDVNKLGSGVGGVGEGGSVDPPPSKKSSPKTFDPKQAELPFDGPEFRVAWVDWCQHRRESGKPLKPTMTKGQLEKLGQMSVQRAIAVLRNSTANGYQGLYEPDHRSRAGPGPPAKKTDSRDELLNLAGAAYEAFENAQNHEQNARNSTTEFAPEAAFGDVWAPEGRWDENAGSGRIDLVESDPNVQRYPTALHSQPDW